MKTNLFIIGLIIAFFPVNLTAQKLEANGSSMSVEQLPEYIVITSEQTKLFGGINITIESKRSKFEDELDDLETLLQNRKKLRIRNQTDLLNAMSKLGYDYIDAFNARAGTIGIGGGDDVTLTGSDSKFRINMVFRKKDKFRK